MVSTVDMTSARRGVVRGRWGRSDQGGLEALIWAVLALGALGLLPRLVGAVRGDPIPLETELPGSMVRPAAGVQGPLTGEVVLADPSAVEQALSLLPAVLGLALAALGAVLLLGIVRALRDGDPFTPGSARRLTLLALLLAVGAPLVQVVGDLARTALLARVETAADLPVQFTLPLWPLLAALLVAFLAEVFARGSALRAEVEGLV